MKGEKCFGLLLVLSIIFGLSLGVSLNVKAIDYDESGIRSFTNCTIDVGGYTYAGIANNGGCSYITNTSISYRTGWANNFTMQMNAALPGKSLVILQGRYNIPGDNYAFTGFSGNSQLTPISSSFALEQDANSYDLNFTYVFYTAVPLSSIVLDSPLSLWVLNNETRVDFTKLSYVTITSEPTRQQIIQLQNSINEINAKSTTTNANLEIIRGYLQDIISDSDRTADAVEEQNERDEQDRSNLESQSSESQSDSNDASQDTATATTNLIGALREFSTAMTGLSSSSCTLPEIQAYGFSLGNLNLCHYTPPAWVQAVTSTVVSFITLKLAIHVFYRVMGALDNVLGKGK